ncbi:MULTISPECIES: hypothetical protein [Natrialbaceae]|uniref:hypothetical protein n=1 Tax=Natrialbaceae TaxID=1644061 RepID=UPI00207CC611|nr:hypothetical protein [Natronococcus sp. CG52]
MSGGCGGHRAERHRRGQTDRDPHIADCWVTIDVLEERGVAHLVREQYGTEED